MPLNVPELIFSATSGAASMGWLALALSPPRMRWSAAVRRITGRYLPGALAVVYVAMLARYATADGDFGSLAGVQRLFAVPGLLAAGWIHYLAFDLFVGSWIAERAAALGIPHLLVLPLLLLTFLFGPAGLLAYAALRATAYRDSRLRAAAAAD